MESARDTVELEETLSTLVLNEQAQKDLKSKFGSEQYDAVIAMMTSGCFEGILGDELHEWLLDTIKNNAEVAWEGTIASGSEFYPVRVYQYSGIFFVWALEYDDVGYFLSEHEAKDFIYFNWDNVSAL